MSGPLIATMSAGASGLFGKLPGQGDFLSRRLPTEFLQVWDPWLQASLSESRAALGDGWLDAYLTSPIWRFVLTPGIAGQAAWAGLLMPSVDRVGRYFPLSVACPLPESVNPFLALSSATDWFDNAQSLMLDALEGMLSLDEMDARLSALPPTQIPLSKLSHSAMPVVCETLGWRLGLPNPLRVSDVMPGLLHRALTEVFFAYSLWWSEGSDRVEPSLLVCQGLPPEPAFTTLYTGDWSAGQWWNLEDPSEQKHLNEGV